MLLATRGRSRTPTARAWARRARAAAAAVAAAVAMAASQPIPTTAAQAAPLPDPLVTVDVVNVPLPQALAALSRASGVDIVLEGQASGSVTLHLTRQPVSRALQILASAYRLDVRREGSAYVVRQLEAGPMVIAPSQADMSAPVSRAYRLRYAQASDVADEIRAALGASPPQAQRQSVTVGQPPSAVQQGQAAQAAPGAPAPGAPGGMAAPSQPAAPSYTAPSPSPSAPLPAPAPPSPAGAPGAQAAPQAGGAQGVAVASDDRANTVIVTAPLALQLQVQDIIAALDQPQPGIVTPQGGPSPAGAPSGEVAPHTVAYPVRYADPQAMSQVLQAEISGITVVTDLRTNTLLVTGSDSAQRRAASLLRALDAPSPQIAIQTEILDLSRSAASQLGIQWTWQPYTIGQVSIGGTPILQQPQPNPQASGIVPIVAALNALVSRGEGKVLANPQVATQSGVQASINVGQTLYVPITNVTNGVATTTLQTINAGILLQVTPRLNEDGMITNTINVQSNSISGFTPQGYPEVTTRSVQSIMTVRDGEPILIGGLISQTTTEAIQKIPLLGDLPVIGSLFRFTSKTDQYDNIVIVMTPRVISPGPRASEGGRP
jgi:type II secretory pathway component GspD/PulD (secretin)